MQEIENGDSRLLVRNKLKANFDDLDARKHPSLILISSSLLNLTNHPDSEQLLGVANSLVIRPTLDTNWFTKIRIGARVNVPSTSINSPRLYVKYTTSLTLNPTFTNIGDNTIASGEAVSLDGQGQRLTNWMDLPAGAIGGSVTFQIFQNGGDGDKDPQLTSVWIEFI